MKNIHTSRQMVLRLIGILHIRRHIDSAMYNPNVQYNIYIVHTYIMNIIIN